MLNSTKHTLARVVSAGVACAGISLIPIPAFAEESAAGSDILIPKIAEFIPALIAFLIIWCILAKFLWPQVLSKMDERQHKIEQDLRDAEQSRLEAKEKAKSYDEHIMEAHREAEKIVFQAKREAEQVRSNILAKAQREASEIVTKAHSSLDSERRKAMIELSGSVVDLSVEIASKIIGNELSEEQQRRLAEKYLQEVSIPDEH